MRRSVLRLTVGLALLLGAVPAAAQRKAPAADSLAIRALVLELTAGAASDSARAAAVYEWVARNVTYDVAAYRRGDSGVASAELVFRERLAVCAGYVALFMRMAREAGLEVVPVRGYAKGFDYVHGRSTRKPNHTWTAVDIAGEWRLVDPTWGSGFVEDGRFRAAFSWDWFMVPPEWLLLSHYPEDGAWQRVAQPLRRADFERMPRVPVAALRAGFAPAAIRAAAVQSRLRELPVVGADAGVARIIEAPLSGTLARSRSYPLDVQWPGAVDVAVVTGDVWTALERTGDRFHGAAVAAASHVYVVGRDDAAAPWRTLLFYRVE